MNTKPLREVIETPLARTFRVYSHDYPFPFSGWHHHPEYELHLVRKSSGLCYVGTYAGPFEAGNLVLTGPNLPHMWVSDTSTPGDHDGEDRIFGRDLVLQFSAGFIDKCVAEFSDCAGLSSFLEESRAGIEFSPTTAAQAAALLERLLEAEGLERLSLFFRILRILDGDERRKPLSLLGSVYECTQPRRLDRMLVYIANNFNRPDLTCQEVAGHEGMGLSAFSRFFERHIKCSCLEYINRLRIYKACQLLMETDDRITAISYDVGYDTLSTFNRNFQRLIGTSPSEFRSERRAASLMTRKRHYGEGETENVSWN